MSPKMVNKKKTNKKKSGPNTGVVKNPVAAKGAQKNQKKTNAPPKTAASPSPKIFSMPFAKVYPLYVAKAAKKGRKRQEVDEVIRWLTGYTQKRLEAIVSSGTDFVAFFAGAKLNPNRKLITGKVCRVEVSEVADPTMREIRYMDKLIDELAQGKQLDKILRK
eukprot:TRINITY_DN34504_c0_g1_i1.p1 TRINITY_DN34504_c0_g1~~TRINITY_DN34504_c0_g1_i1.p1  ORF type:complete len:163 (-),score=28.41 TRINITY_DN34504_c0_g1_i1:242-730(-)